MTKKGKEKVEALGSIGILTIIVGFMAGVIITGIGGGWEAMQKSFVIMIMYSISQIAIVFGIAFTTICAAIWNKTQ